MIPFSPAYFSSFILNTTSWDPATLTTALIKKADELNRGEIDVTDPDISPFARRGGKLLQYAGWSDPGIPAGDSIYYYSRVAEYLALNSTLNIDDHYRLWLVPGMAHCHSGKGANAFGGSAQAGQGMPAPCAASSHHILLAAVDWVEHGKTPSEIVATKWRDNDASKGEIEFQRRLCMYPLRSVYGGGDPASADSFSCQA